MVEIVALIRTTSAHTAHIRLSLPLHDRIVLKSRLVRLDEIVILRAKGHLLVRRLILVFSRLDSVCVLSVLVTPVGGRLLLVFESLLSNLTFTLFFCSLRTTTIPPRLLSLKFFRALQTIFRVENWLFYCHLELLALMLRMEIR